MYRDTLHHWLLKYYSFQREYSEKEVFAMVVKNRMVESIMSLKVAAVTAETAVSRLTSSKTEGDAKWHSLSEIEYMQGDIYDMHVLSLTLKEHPNLSLLDEDTVEKIRRETRKLLGETLPGLRAEIATVKKDAKTYQNIAKHFKEMLQGVSNLDLYLVRYSGDVAFDGLKQ